MNTSAALSRRQFLARAATAAAIAGLSPAQSAAQVATAEPASARPPTSPEALIDTNVYLGRWPFRRHSLEDPAALVDKLRGQAVTEAWVGSFDALLYKDFPGVNARLAEACRRHGDGLLVPFGTVNPAYVGWEGELHRCVKVHRMRGIRLFPNYHGYKLSDPRAESLLRRAADLGLLVQIPLALEDERTIHPLVNVPVVDSGPLGALVEKIPGLRVQLLNAFRALRGAPLLTLAAKGVRFETATLDGLECVAHLLTQLRPTSLCFGSYAPEFYFEAAVLKLKESVLTDTQTALIRFKVARQLLGGA